ncbi:ALK and LTK ligand 2 [Tupaia chinensis]|uniref:ALK and LTK ligand 2 n=1 Tax=Tupaia chinensis TaxID=246437 RepID=UPI000FFC53F3|nr:ALK and LTK ligand 2 [Tupaia chinensis]
MTNADRSLLHGDKQSEATPMTKLYLRSIAWLFTGVVDGIMNTKQSWLQDYDSLQDDAEKQPGGRGRTEPREPADGQMLLRLVVELVQELRKHHAGEPKRLQLLAGRAADPGASAEEQRVEIVPRDLRMKDKFLKHLTGPLSFGPKCSKHFHRLYHNTRDCTVPAHYKRCARLLTRLAVSPMCMEG